LGSGEEIRRAVDIDGTHWGVIGSREQGGKAVGSDRTRWGVVGHHRM